MKLENWAVHYDEVNPYLPPECQHQYLSGEVYGHYKYFDGERITTSRPVKVEGKKVTTYSGSIYELGEPSVDYVEYLKSIGREKPETITLIKSEG